MIERIIYRCDECKEAFCHRPWLLGAQVADEHFCDEACRTEWVNAHYPDPALRSEGDPRG